MNQVYGRSAALALPVATRWNSVHTSLSSLLRVKTALRCFANRYSHMREFPPKLRILMSADWWIKVEELVTVLYPFAKASLNFQRSDANLGDVVFRYVSLYRVASEGVAGASLARAIEYRWGLMEQPLFLLAFFLNPRPKFRLQSFQLLANCASLKFRMTEAAVSYYQVFLRSTPQSLRRGMTKWLDFSQGKWTPNAIRWSEFESPISFWKYLSASPEEDVLHLAKLGECRRPDKLLRRSLLSMGTDSRQSSKSIGCRKNKPNRNSSKHGQRTHAKASTCY